MFDSIPSAIFSSDKDISSPEEASSGEVMTFTTDQSAPRKMMILK